LPVTPLQVPAHRYWENLIPESRHQPGVRHQ